MTPKSLDVIPVRDTEVICNSCNRNIHQPLKCPQCGNHKIQWMAGTIICLKCDYRGEKKDFDSFGWLIYFDKQDVKDDRPYDIYCNDCTERSFPEAVTVT